ncbi:TetR/AcrR family transcriptional regulator [Paraburkholderia kururiensis]|uniref:TetR/AcrR family transcriptional regulator n=1 Tax=Paraburkholderia kururiensis TaxID=984307 RepID=UPI0005A970C0|nr:TetR/AcrR family transcriptional regulator [Paraburkholderia kururiensis]
MGIAERKTREKQALRERVLDAARRIVMRDGFAALSMRKIADAIEYSPATLYLYFKNRDEIAHALCAEGYAQLLETFAPLAAIEDPRERLHALGRAYVAFGLAHPQTYRLIFMEDPSYTSATLAGNRSDDSGDAAFQMMIDAFDALRDAGRLPLPSTASAVWAEALWSTLHGIVALQLTCSAFPHAAPELLVDVALGAWFAEPGRAAKMRGKAATKPRARLAAKAGGNAAKKAQALSDTDTDTDTGSDVKRKAALPAKASAKPASNAAGEVAADSAAPASPIVPAMRRKAGRA